jgi:predicted TIM-barrel fold metal-dependent hydrolase
VQALNHEWTYQGPIFDAHTHVVGTDLVDLMVDVQNQYGIDHALVIAHSKKARDNASELFPNRFIFAKYFSGTMILSQSINSVIKEVECMKEEGFEVAKLHFAPFWRHRVEEILNEKQIDNPAFDGFFDALSDEGVPVIIHTSDPDTYYSTRYTNTEFYGTKEQHVREFETRVARNGTLKIQAAHFAAQPEPRWIENLDRMMDSYQNLYLDTSSARWMSRELGRNPDRSREFFEKHVSRILFATDCVTRTDDRSYYEGRHEALRLLLETDVRGVPLPFPDADTVDSGGTYINGLAISEDALKRIYWSNAEKLYGL